jgi:hypothetical protein
MGFPDDTLDLIAEAAFGADLTADPDTWTWTDLSDRLLNDPVTIRRGVQVGASQAQVTSGAVNLTNEDGALTPMLAASPFYPYVDAGTPVRLGVRHQDAVTDVFTRTAVASGWGTADTGDVWTPTTGSEAAFSTTGTQARMSHTVLNFIRSIRVNRTIRDVEVLFDASIGAVQTGSSSVIGPQLRRIGTGATSLWPTLGFGLLGAVTLRAYRVVGGTLTAVATQVVPALTYSAGTMLRCRVQVDGTRIRMRAWLAAGTEPTTWHIDTTDSGVTGIGESIAMASWVFAGNTNTLPTVFTVDNVAITQMPSYRLEGYITDVQPTFTPLSGGETYSTVQVEVGGIGSRLEKQQPAVYSPLRRSVQLADLPPIAYWPLEDDQGSTYAASAYPGGPRMTVTGPAVFAFDVGTPSELFLARYGTKPMVSLAAGARLTASVPLSSVVGEWAVSVVAEFYEPDVPATTEMRIMQWDTPGSLINRWAFVATDAGYVVRAYKDSLSTSTDVISYTTVFFVGQATWTIEGSQNGANIDLTLFINDVNLATGSIADTQSPVTKVALNPDQANTTASVTTRGLKFIVGHLRVTDEVSVHDTPFYGVPETGVTVTAIFAWYQEPAHRRIERLCDEEQVPFTLLGDPATTGWTLLNSQQEGAFSALVASAADSESGGLLYEDGFGYAYLPRTARYNADVALTVDLSEYARSSGDDQESVLVPQLESRAANYWTVKRNNGAEGSFAADAAYRARRGTINEQVTLDVYRDSDTDLHAQWRVHLGTDGRDAYYPGMPVDLSANPDLIDSWLTCAPGSRVQRTNQPTIAGVGTIDQVIDGYSETISPRSWLVEINASPASVWDVGEYGTAVYSPAASTLQSGISSGALSMSVGGDTWVTGAVSLLLEIGGEHMTVTNITGSGPYTMTISARSVNGVVAAHLAGAAVHLANPSRYGL